MAGAQRGERKLWGGGGVGVGGGPPPLLLFAPGGLQRKNGQVGQRSIDPCDGSVAAELGDWGTGPGGSAWCQQTREDFPTATGRVFVMAALGATGDNVTRW